MKEFLNMSPETSALPLVFLGFFFLLILLGKSHKFYMVILGFICACVLTMTDFKADSTQPINNSIGVIQK